jgi:hypothetical protein
MNRNTLTTSLAPGAGLLLLLPLLAASCTQHKIDTASTVDVRPIEVKPIHITVDVNVRIDRQLDEFFAFEEQVDGDDKPGAAGPGTQPSAGVGAATGAGK